MAMSSDSNSRLADWDELYGHHNEGLVGPTMTTGQLSSLPDSTIINTAAVNMEASRVGRSPRGRSRASRRAPVTLLNTDTSNFRAMVQQFMGIPSGRYSSAGSLSRPTTTFELDFGATTRPNGAVMSFGQLQLPFQEQVFRSEPEEEEQQQQQQQQQRYEYGGNMFTPGEFSSNNNNNNEDNDLFIHRFANDGRGDVYFG